jgi:hypothetical protein
METTIQGTTALIKVDSRFINLLVEDFGIDTNTITRALEGEPQRQAIAICEWAAKTDEPATALTNWAKKHACGQYRPVKARSNRARRR